jgi:hypothetical protein
MQLQLRRRSGQPVHEELWRSASDIPAVDLEECVKDVLMSFYDGDEENFWPKDQFSAWVPEVARIVDTDGQVLAEFDVDDLAEDTGRSFADHPPTTGPIVT